MDKEILNSLAEAIKSAFDEQQRLPNQFVVGYYRKDTDERIGYHADTFCNMTDDILNAKRYSSDNPYPQLEVIFKNLKSLFERYPSNGIFSEITNAAKEAFGDITLDNIYIDATYLEDGIQPQQCRLSLIDLTDKE